MTLGDETSESSNGHHMTDTPPRTPLPRPTAADETFPTLTAAQIARVASRGKARRVESGDVLLRAGEHAEQFFVVTAADAGLPPEYAVLGTVTGGLGTVERIGKLGDAQEHPTETVEIEHVRIDVS